jgi:Lsr2
MLIKSLPEKGSSAASKVVTLLTDDLDGSEAEETISFSLEGFSYEIDLSKAHAEDLRDALDPYVKAGRRTGRDGRRRGRGSATDGDQTKAIRDWAKSQKMEVSDRGRVSAEIREAYSKAH